MTQPHRPALILLFAKKFFRAVRTHGGTNEVERGKYSGSWFWSCGCRTHLLPAFTAPRLQDDWPMGSRTQLQQRNCSRFARDFLRRSTNQTRKELAREVAACASSFKIYLINPNHYILRHRVFFQFPSPPAHHRRCRLYRIESYSCSAGEISRRTADRD
jgi:hypothetical protein